IIIYANNTSLKSIYSLSLHDALPIFFINEDIEAGFAVETLQLKVVVVVAKGQAGLGQSLGHLRRFAREAAVSFQVAVLGRHGAEDRKSTRLNSSHVKISYAVFCLKKK